MKSSKVVVWFEIYVNDIDRATKFYEQVLDTKLETLGDPTDQGLKMMSFPGNMDSYGTGGALVQMQGVKAGNNSTIVYFDTKECSIEESRVESAGGKIFKPKMSIGEYGYVSLCLDSEGNMFGLHSME